MTPHRSLSEISRLELYDLIWSTPAIKLCKDFSVSDVAIAKHCRKLNIPRPSRGYWAKAPARRPRKPPLPLTPAEVFLQAARKPVTKTLLLPKTAEQLHPKAAELLSALNVAKPDSHKRLDVRQPTLPEVRVTRNLAERVAKAFHVIIQDVEPLGISFSKSQSKHDGGHFRKGHDRLYFKIEEEFVEGTDTSNRSRSDRYWAMKLPIPSAYLTFIVQTERYGSRKPKRWEEDEKAPLDRLLPQIVQEIRQHFVEAQERRAREAIEREERRVKEERRWQEYREKEAIRMQEEQKRKHNEALEGASWNRQADLIKAAEWWRVHQVVHEFVANCERRWCEKQSGQLTPQQEEWLRWAGEAAAALSPFEVGYPDPVKDGGFDLTTIPSGGPYPATRDFPSPPTMPVIPAPVVVQQGSDAPPSHTVASKPYPFWLKYQRRK